MTIPLAGYTRKWTAGSREPAGRGAMIVGGIVVAHCVVLGLLVVTPRVVAQLWGASEAGETVEVVRYFDIAIESATGAMELPPELADSFGLPSSAEPAAPAAP